MHRDRARGRGGGRGRAWGITGALLLLAGCAHKERPPGPAIDRFEIVGNEQVDDKAIEKRIATEAPSWLPFTADPVFNPGIWRTDLERVKRYYQARGYYQAQLEDEVESLPKDRVRLLLRVDEGPPTKIARIEVDGLEGLPDAQRESARAAVQLKEGDVFEEETWESVGDRIVPALQAFGYAEAKVRFDATVDLGTQEAVLRIAVDPGARYRFGEVHVMADELKTVPAWRVAEQVEEALEGEKWFSPKALDEARARLVGLGVFSAVRLQPGEGDPETGRIPIQVHASEIPLRELALGGGIGLDQLRQSIHGVGRLTHRNFFGNMRVLSLEVQAGWAFVPNFYSASVGGADIVARNGPIAKITSELRQPRLFHPNFSVATRLELERGIEPAYAFLGGRGRVGVPWRPVSWFTAEMAYGLELYRLDQGSTTLIGTAPDLLFGCQGTCSLSFVEQTFAVDRRDDVSLPKRGYYLGLALQEGGGPLGGTFDFVRVLPEARGYFSVLEDRRLTLSGRFRIGSLIPLSGGTFDTPIVSRFYSGGDGMRGFGVMRLSPQRLIEQQTSSGIVREPAPVGGNGLFESSVEGRYDLTQLISLALFVDAGFVTPEALVLTPSNFSKNMLYAIGTGVRYRTPVGALRLDFAFRPDIGPPLPVFDPQTGERIVGLPGAGCLGFGKTSPNYAGAPESICAIHLSVGEAF